eukprot:5904787-Pyramimonas_sp.AAC.1
MWVRPRQSHIGRGLLLGPCRRIARTSARQFDNLLCTPRLDPQIIGHTCHCHHRIIASSLTSPAACRRQSAGPKRRLRRGTSTSRRGTGRGES